MRFLRSRTKHNTPDEELLREYRSTGNTKAIEILFERYCYLAFAQCMKYLKNEDDSKDAVIQVFEQMHTDLRKYHVASFNSWLYTVTKNHCLKLLKERKINENLDDIDLPADTEDDVFELSGKEAKLEEALASLASEQATCIRLFYLEGKTYRETQELTGFSYGQVKSHIQNGKRKLRIFLEKKNGN
jgi:RNA polymerase sigma-70 factor (ECF subfamily)